jgi:hypothetical protein
MFGLADGICEHERITADRHPFVCLTCAVAQQGFRAPLGQPYPAPTPLRLPEKNERDNGLPNLLNFLSDQAVWQKATSHLPGLAKTLG